MTSIKTPAEIAQRVLDAHSIRPDWRRTGDQIAKLIAEGIEADRAQIAPRRTITIDLDTGEWVNHITLWMGDGARVAASVLPGMPAEEIERAYSAWLSDDPAPDVPGFEGTREALDALMFHGEA